MYIFRNALRNVVIFKSRNILVFIIIIIISAMSCGSLIMLQASRKHEDSQASIKNLSVDFGSIHMSDNVFNTHGRVATSIKEAGYASIAYEGAGTAIYYDMLSKYYAETKEDLQKHKDLDPDVSSYDIVSTHLVGGNNFKSYFLATNQIYKILTDNKIMTAFSDKQFINVTWCDPDDFSVRVVLGNYGIYDGRMYDDYTSEPECVVDIQLAEARNLVPGDMIKIYSIDREYDVKITGTYNSNFITNAMKPTTTKTKFSYGAQEIQPGPRFLSDTEYNIEFNLPTIFVNTSLFDDILTDGDYGMDLDFYVVGFPTDDSLKDFIEGTKSIVFGKVFDPLSDAYECIISDELAKKNNIVVGDEIILRGKLEDSKDYPFKVVGTYVDLDHGTKLEDVTKGVNSIYSTHLLKVPLDTIYMSYSALSHMLDDIDTYTLGKYQRADTVRFFFANSQDLNDYYLKVIGQSYLDRNRFQDATTDSKEYFSQLLFNKRTTTFALSAFIIVILIAAFFLFMYSAYNMRERQYEIGVLISMGMSEGKIVMQFFSEIIIVVITAAFIGTMLGSLAGPPIGHYLTEQRIESLTAQKTSIVENFGREADILSFNELNNSTVNATLTINMVLWIMGAFAVTTLGATANTASIIAKFEPITILSSR